MADEQSQNKEKKQVEGEGGKTFFKPGSNINQGGTCRIPLTPEEQEQKSEPAQLYEITWRIFRIMSEFVEGFQFLSKFEREVTIFGSARTEEGTRWYKEARKLGRLLAKNDYTVVTGGGPGIMEAANRGAHEADGRSVGINIQLPMEQRINPYVNKSRGFHYFFTRKVMLAASAQVYVYFPGGFGTMDELFELSTLVQTGKSEQIPIVLVGKDFWEPLMDWIKNTLYEEHGNISEEDMDIMHVVDTAEEVLEVVCDSTERTFF
jgi:hypothetical protein